MSYVRRFQGRWHRFRRRCSHNLYKTRRFPQVTGKNFSRLQIPKAMSPFVFAMLILSGFSAGIFLYCITTDTMPQFGLERNPESQTLKANDFFVIDGYEVKENRNGRYSIDAKLPLIQSAMEGASDINAEIASDFWYLLDPTPGNIAQAFSGWVDPQITVDYTWVKKGSVVTVIITSDIASEYIYEPVQMTYEYRYDVRQRRVLK